MTIFVKNVDIKFILNLLLSLNNIDLTDPAKTGGCSTEYRVLLVKTDKFISDYQGRIYVDTPSQAFDKNGNIRTERMLEVVSEMFREYLENPMNLAENHPEYYALIEEALK